MSIRDSFDMSIETGIYRVEDKEGNEVGYDADLDSDGDWCVNLTDHVVPDEEYRAWKLLGGNTDELEEWLEHREEFLKWREEHGS